MFLIFQQRKERGTFVKKKGGVDVIWYNVKYTWILLLIMPKDKEETFQLSKNIFVVKMLMPSHCRILFFSLGSHLILFLSCENLYQKLKWCEKQEMKMIHNYILYLYNSFFFSIHVIYNGV